MSMYIDPEMIDDETAVTEAVLAALTDRLSAALGLPEGEEWEPQEGSPETSLAESVGIMLATAVAMFKDRAREDYAGFGRLILSTPRQAAEPASALARFDFDDSGVHTVEDGTELILDAADGTPVAFATVGDSEDTGAFIADVPVAAVESGAIGNELVGLARDFERLPHLQTVTLTTASSGGADEETRDEYLERIVRRARRMKLVPIVTDDYADTALDHPSVGSAVAVRLLNLDAPTDPPAAEGHVTVFVRGHDGENLSPEVKDEVRDMMRGEDRPLAVTVHVGDPTRTPITVAVSYRLATGADEAATTAAIQAAITDAYDDAAYGIDDDAPGGWRAPRTDAERTINEYDVAALIDDIAGNAKIEEVTINGVESVTLDGWAPLPELTAPPTVTVVA